METATTQVVPTPKKGVSTGLIVILIVILIGGGVGVFFALKPKKDQPEGSSAGNSNEEGGAEGRDISDHQFQLTPDFIASVLAQQKPSPTTGKGSSPDNPLYYKSNQALELIANTAQDMQLHEATMNIIRANYDIGKGMMAANSEQQECIDELFSKLLNVDLTSDPDRRYLAYPVYGTFEPQGKKYRAELQNLVNAGWEGLNLTDLRDGSSPWWCQQIGLNLLVGTTVYNTPTTHNTWASWAPRSELNFFKKFNQMWVDDKDLADVYLNRNNSQQVVGKTHPDARAAYCATGMYEFVRRWISEIDRLDEMTRFEAFKWLQVPDENDVRWYFTYINPDTGEDEEETNKNPFNLSEGQKGRNS